MLRKMFITHSFLRGARGNLALIVKQHSVTGFDVKLTLRKALPFPYPYRGHDTALPFPKYRIRQCRFPTHIQLGALLWTGHGNSPQKKDYKRRKMCDRTETNIAFLAKNDRPFRIERSPFVNNDLTTLSN